MVRWMIGTLVVAIALGGVASAQEKKKGKKRRGGPAGSWVREAGDARLQFTFKGRRAQFTMIKGGEKAMVDADIGIAKGGIMFGRISKVTPQGGEGPKAGMLFSWRFRVRENTLTISEVNAGEHTEEARKVIEGKYEKQNK